MKVLLAMSGGVDSAVAALVLREQGHEVVGVTLQLADLSERGLGVSRCCSAVDVATAREVAARLGIDHYTLDFEDVFRREVLDPFVAAYLAGSTPSPCIRCNSRVKFGELLPVADQLGCERVASGHYARLRRGHEGAELCRGADAGRDQSYFLFELSRRQLERLLFPLGDLTKDEVRRRARAAGLPNADRRDSQEVCFVPPGLTYTDVLERLAPDALPEAGETVDAAGAVLGRHGGIHRFTPGQRHGLGVAGRHRLYVTALDPERNRVVVGSEAELERHTLLLAGANWLAPVARTFPAAVQIRSHHRAELAEVTVVGETGARVELAGGVRAPAPGQAAVCYWGERVVGGGWIVGVS